MSAGYKQERTAEYTKWSGSGNINLLLSESPMSFGTTHTEINRKIVRASRIRIKSVEIEKERTYWYIFTRRL